MGGSDLLWAAEVRLGRWYGRGGSSSTAADSEVDPTGELGRIAKKDVADVRMLDAGGGDVSDVTIDPVRELEDPGDDRYTVVLDRADGSGTSVSFLFVSGEPTSFARDGFRQLLADAPTA